MAKDRRKLRNKKSHAPLSGTIRYVKSEPEDRVTQFITKIRMEQMINRHLP